MTQSIVAKRYARALFELAKEQGKLDEVGADLNELVKAAQLSPELISILDAPKITADKKKAMVAELFTGADTIVIHMLQMLIDKKRVSEVAVIASAYAELAASERGAAQAVVYSTRELTQAECDSVSVAFAKRVGKQSLTITNKIEPSLLGGIRVQIGNHIFDSTVSAKLARLENELIG